MNEQETPRGEERDRNGVRHRNRGEPRPSGENPSGERREARPEKGREQGREQKGNDRERRGFRVPQRPSLPPRRTRATEGGRFGRPLRTLLVWALIFVTMLLGIQYLGGQQRRPEVSYTWFREQIEKGNLASVDILEKEVHGELKEPAPIMTRSSATTTRSFKVVLPGDNPELPDLIWKTNPHIEINARSSGTNWVSALVSWFPILLLLGFWIFFMRQMQVGGNRAFSFGKSKARLLTGDRPKVTFADVAGATEAKQELREIIEFLKDPRKFQKLGGRIPKGALLLGAPGTGKTLLARAVAGEAGVPFFSMSGSDFVEMFVGVGASRVRDLFEQGKRHAPCIIFIDEIDAVGRWRGAGLGGGHDEREQTLNQLLVEMDGFESNDGVILVAATNRPDVLDPALLRPGRFDRQIVVDMPDVKGREGILRVHTKKVPLAQGVSLRNLARGTPGLSGADLANLVNESALLAARRNHTVVTMADLEDAKDKVMMGPERRSMVIRDEDRRVTAYHEAGHVLVGLLLPGGDPVHKVTIIPRGRALGLTWHLPEDERYTYSKDYYLSILARAMGGRAAEKVAFEEISTGAAGDIVKATTLARKMVCEWGMSEAVGPLTYGEKEEQIFLGREISQRRDYSEETAVLIDKEVRAIVEGAQRRAEELLRGNMEILKRLAEALLEHESLDKEDIERLFKGEVLRKQARRHGRRDQPSEQDADNVHRGEASGRFRDDPKPRTRPAEGPAPA